MRGEARVRQMGVDQHRRQRRGQVLGQESRIVRRTATSPAGRRPGRASRAARRPALPGGRGSWRPAGAGRARAPPGRCRGSARRRTRHTGPGSTTPMVWVRRLLRLRAARVRAVAQVRWRSSSTRWRTASATFSWPLSARDTVATETLATRATSLMVTFKRYCPPSGRPSRRNVTVFRAGCKEGVIRGLSVARAALRSNVSEVARPQRPTGPARDRAGGQPLAAMPPPGFGVRAHGDALISASAREPWARLFATESMEAIMPNPGERKSIRECYGNFVQYTGCACTPRVNGGKT